MIPNPWRISKCKGLPKCAHNLHSSYISTSNSKGKGERRGGLRRMKTVSVHDIFEWKYFLWIPHYVQWIYTNKKKENAPNMCSWYHNTFDMFTSKWILIFIFHLNLTSLLCFSHSLSLLSFSVFFSLFLPLHFLLSHNLDVLTHNCDKFSFWKESSSVVVPQWSNSGFNYILWFALSNNEHICKARTTSLQLQINTRLFKRLVTCILKSKCVSLCKPMCKCRAVFRARYLTCVSRRSSSIQIDRAWAGLFRRQFSECIAVGKKMLDRKPKASKDPVCTQDINSYEFIFPCKLYLKLISTFLLRCLISSKFSKRSPAHE